MRKRCRISCRLKSHEFQSLSSQDSSVSKLSCPCIRTPRSLIHEFHSSYIPSLQRLDGPNMTLLCIIITYHGKLKSECHARNIVHIQNFPLSSTVLVNEFICMINITVYFKQSLASVQSAYIPGHICNCLVNFRNILP